MRLISGVQELFNIFKSVNVLCPINKTKENNHMISSIDADKTVDQIQHLFVIKSLSKVTIEKTYLNTIKTISNKPIANIVLSNKV